MNAVHSRNQRRGVSSRGENTSALDLKRVSEKSGSNGHQDEYKKGVRDTLKKQHESEIKELRMEAVKEGVKEHIKERVKTSEKIKERLQSLVEHEDTQILNAKTFFPFDFFPDILVIDATKVSITAKRFFATERVTVIHFKDISEVEVETSLFLANLTITYLPRIEGMMAPPELLKYKVRLLRRGDAIRAQQIIKGLLIAKREGVEIARLSPEEIEEVIQQLGESNVPI